ncbi:phosphoribosyltransferase family protein [Nocardia ninae]|uniref:phosphoribosyltransferase family protein n=1 Tax=Nocardia ninae TaxID=356145 RepID=UPI002482B297|nr:phosphoribosyltransferase family protein [Nocardia ninae]
MNTIDSAGPENSSAPSLSVTFGDHLVRNLPIVPVAPDLEIAFLKLYGDVELLDHCVKELAKQISDAVEVLVGAEAGGILLTHGVATATGLPCAIARKKRRPHMVSPVSVTVGTIGTPGLQELFLDDADQRLIAGRRVAVIDEVLSSGATQQAMTTLVAQAGGQVVQTLVVATEGERRADVTHLVHLPVNPSEVC